MHTEQQQQICSSYTKILKQRERLRPERNNGPLLHGVRIHGGCRSELVRRRRCSSTLRRRRTTTHALCAGDLRRLPTRASASRPHAAVAPSPSTTAGGAAARAAEVLGELEVIAGRRRERVGRSRLGKMGMIRESRVRVRYYTEGPTRNFWKV